LTKRRERSQPSGPKILKKKKLGNITGKKTERDLLMKIRSIVKEVKEKLIPLTK
jgi:hypothetical protein